MIVNTHDLNDAALDWAVCMANGLKPDDIKIDCASYRPAHLWRRLRDEDGTLNGRYMTGTDLMPSRHWESGGPLIDKARITTRTDTRGGDWVAFLDGERVTARAVGSTALVAAMRCFVASKLGDTVEVPKELVTKR